MKVQARHYFAIFVLAFATLSYQILINPLFHAVLYYHFSFAALSLATFCLSALACGAGWIIVRGSSNRRVVGVSRIVTLTLLTAALAHTVLSASGKPHLGVFWAKGEKQTGTLFERWNTFSRVRVIALGVSTPFGWGMVSRPQSKIDQKYLDIDAGASTVITRWDNDLSKLSYLKTDVVNSAYL